jgi:glycosyltransferase involved in cell wall biosynthesis
MRFAIPTDVPVSGWSNCAQNLVLELNKLPSLPDSITVHAINNNNFGPLYEYERTKVNLGIGFWENDLLAEKVAGNLSRFDWTIWGSSWNANLLKSWGVENCSVMIQGVNHDIFRPTPQPAREGFTVGSWGKFEHRKGHDIIIAAMSIFMQRHSDVYFHCGWYNLWGALIDTMAWSPYIIFAKQGNCLDTIQTTLRLNGLPPDRCAVHPIVENRRTADFYRDTDIAVFANRAEGGTNLPLMECASCGIPIVAPFTTGHQDVLVPGGFLEVETIGTRRWPPTEEQIAEWPEPSVESVLEQLEYAYDNSEDLQRMAALASENVNRFTWEAAAKTIWDKAREYAR